MTDFYRIDNRLTAIEVREGVYAYLSGEADTTCTLADTFYPIQGTFVNNPIVNFSLGIEAIVYDGNKDCWFEIDWHATIAASANTTIVHVGVAIDGETLASESPSAMGTLLKTADEPYVISGTDVVLLSPSSTIQLQCSADGAGDVITFHHFTTSIKRFFAAPMG